MLRKCRYRSADSYLEDVCEAVLVVQGKLFLENGQGSICFQSVLLPPCVHAVATVPTPSVPCGALLGSYAAPGWVRLCMVLPRIEL